MRVDVEKKVSSLINKNSFAYRYTLLFIALLISAISYNLFLRPAHIVTGGTNGIAIIIEYLFNVDSSIVILILNLIFLIFCFIFLGKKESFGVLFITIVYPFLVYAFSFLVKAISINNSNILIMMIYAGTLSGISAGLIYKVGFNTGGIGVISKMIYKYKNISVAFINSILSFFVIALGVFVFDIDMLMYAIVVIVITKIVTESILLGISRNKTIFIVTEKHEILIDFLNKELNHDTTVFDIIGSNTSINSKMIMVIIPNTQYFILKDAIFDIDRSAFVFASDSYESARQDILINSK